MGEESSAGLAGAGVSGLPVAPLIAPLGRVQASVRRGDTVRVEVVVRTRKVGHFFPGGTVDAFDCWVELEARDNHGRIIFWSGEAADNGHGPVDPGAHFYRSLQLDAHGNPINKRNAWSTRATMYAHLIPPGAADTVHYRLKIPEDCGDSDHADRQAELPQVFLVEYPVGVCGRARSCRPASRCRQGPRRRALGISRQPRRMSPPIPSRFPTCRPWS